MINIDWVGKLILQALTNQNWGVRIPYDGQTGTTEIHYNGAAELLDANKFPKRVFLAFSTTTPVVNADGTISNFSEPTGGNYARQELTKMGPGNQRILSTPRIEQRLIGVYNSTSTDPTTTPPDYSILKYICYTKNENEIILFPYTGNSGYSAPITHFGFYNAQTNGTIILFGQLKNAVTVQADKVPVILKNGLEISFG